MLRTNWGLTLVLVAVFVSACGEVTTDDSAKLTRGTDIQTIQPDAGAAPSPDAGGAGGMTGSGGAPGTGGAGAGGVTGAGGTVSGAGGAAAPSYTCDDLLKCCDSIPLGTLRTMCLAAYSNVTSGTAMSGTCSSVLAMLKANTVCQ